MEKILKIENITKIYKLYPSQKARFFEILTGKKRHKEIVALRDINFSIEKGESFGIVGENGAGKSTLLKIITGCTYPTRGRVEKGGKVASILELGMGFHFEFSGRENAILNSALLGLSKEEMKKTLPKIIEYSELGGAIDQPLKTYSSGMVMRLAFAVAINVNPDILIIDEALAVGDGYFQKKCIDSIREIQRKGKTLILSSHALYYISSLCHRAIWLQNGEMAKIGDSKSVAYEYENYLNSKEKKGKELKGKDEKTPAYFKSVKLTNGIEEKKIFSYKEKFQAEIEIFSEDKNLPLKLGFVLFRNDEVHIFTSTTLEFPPLMGKNNYFCRFSIPSLPLIKGEYRPAFFLTDEEGLHIYNIYEIPKGLIVEPPEWYRFFGIINPETHWDLDI